MNTLSGLVVLLVVAALARARNLDQPAAPAAANYDQRQEGKVNVQIDVKDVQVLALVDSEMIDDYIQNYDYAYDYADFTIKPGSRPTKPPSTTTEKSTSPSSDSSSSPQSTTTTAKLPEKLNLTGITNSPIQTFIIGDNDTNTEGIKVIVQTGNENNKTNEPPQQPSSELVPTSSPASSTVVPAVHPESRKRCPVGFHLKSGRCFKRRGAMISPRFALMKLAPALIEQSKVLLNRRAEIS